MRRTTILVLAALILAGAAQAQDFPGIARGFEPEKSYQIGAIESVGLFNGGLTLTLPIGGTYPIGPGFGLQLTLVYSSHLWRYQQSSPDNTQLWPSEGFNAGLGWTVSLGRLLHPDDLANDSDSFVYYDQSGARHDFYAELHATDAGDPGPNPVYRYTRDGSYLRLITGSAPVVQFPDGSQQTFGQYTSTPPVSYPLYRLISWKDTFNNAVDITYPSTATTQSWVISSPATFGTMEVVFDVSPAAGHYATRGGVVKEIKIKATNGRPASYLFSYTTVPISPGQGCPAQQSPQVKIPFLTQMLLPDGAKWELPWASGSYHTTGSSCAGNPLGLIRKLTLPTQGRLEWTWGSYSFPQVADRCRDSLSNQVGLAARRRYTRDGVLDGAWAYAQGLDHVFTGCGPIPPTNPPHYSNVIVTSPLGDETQHFFSVNTKGGAGRARLELYGYPMRGVSHQPTPPVPAQPPQPADSLGPEVSTKVYDGTVAGGNLVRSTYVRYEWDGGASVEESGTRANQRLSFTNTVYHDEGSRFANQTFSDFEGFGHYRKATLGGTFGAGDVAETVVSFNPTYPAFPHDGTASTTPWPTASKWVLGTYTEKKTCEGDVFGTGANDCESGQQAREQFCFNPTTGFLARHRVLAGTVPQGNDLLALFTHSGGFVTSEQSYGGDGAGLNTTADVCAATIPATDTYRSDHTYQNRARATTKYSGVGFFTLDQTIDAWTGLPVISRDTAGISTGYEYDLLGRLTWAKPAVGHGGWSEITYNNAVFTTSPPVSTKASVVIERHDNGSESAPVLASSSIVFDDLGRVYREFVDLANGTLGRRQTLYNAMGWKQYVSEQATPNEGNFNTQFGNYDPFGRPRSITPPDSSAHVVQLSYAGDRVVTRTVKIGTSRDGTGAIVEQAVATTETYDRQGRLAQVQEYSGTGSTATTTTYKYDVGGRLKQVSTNGQNRFFNYDARGFLTSETHPEKGSSGNGTVTYGGYDARGHARTKVDGPFALTYAFDRAERLLSVRETNPPQRLLKEWQYDTGAWAGSYPSGKATQAVRHNWVTIPWQGTVTDMAITEQNTYSGRDGRLSSRATSASFNGYAFSQSWIYNALGQVTSLGYPVCTHATCTASPGAAAARTVNLGYTEGWLTSIAPPTGTAYGTLTYHSNGLVNQVIHGNGVTDTQANDPVKMRRPLSITTSAVPVVLGPYKYDGAGNITDIGNNRFLYDRVSRITEFKFDSGHQQTYTYDVWGNLTGITTTPPGGPAQPRSFVITGTTNHLSSVPYDGAGNQLSWGSYSYLYDAFGIMTRMQGAGNDNTHLYTADDERIWTIDSVLGGGEAGTTQTFRLRDSDAKVLREYRLLGTNLAGHWSLVKDYVYRDRGLLLASVSPTAGTVHYTLDHLGTPRLATNATGGYVSDHHYYAYGEELNPNANETKKFTGHERDFNEAGQGTADDLDYAHARYCSPITGRFLGVDQGQAKLPKPQSWNRYAYTEGNPLKYSDPDGNETRAEIMFNQDVEDLVEGRISREEFKERLDARGAGALFAASLLAPGPEDVILAAAAGKLLGRVGSFFARIFGKADEVADAAKAASRASEAAADGASEFARVATRTTRSGEKGVRITTNDGRVIDITSNRVKEFVREPRAEGGLRSVKFKDAIPGSKGKKRQPTQAELELLRRLTS